MGGFLDAILTVMQPYNLLALVVGVALGSLFSAIPGLTSTLALALLLPLTYSLPTDTAFVIMIGLMGGGLYGGMLTAITLNIPGAPGSVATTFDGHPMFRNGQGGKAIGWATVSSIIGGVISSIILAAGALQLAKVALSFGPPEMFALTIFGMAAVISLNTDLTKSALAGIFGLILGTVGIDAFGDFRFHFGVNDLAGGMPLLPAVVGLFALVKVFQAMNTSIEKPTISFSSAEAADTRMRPPGIKSILKRWKTLLRGSLIGTFVGFLPGAGGNIAAFAAYNVEKRASRTPEKFGQGAEEGVIASESANNATPGGSLIPTLTLGIPGDQFAAVMIGGFIIHGLPVGPLLFRDHVDIIYVIFVTTFLMNFLFLPIGWVGSMMAVPLARLRDTLLIPIIAAFSLAGLFAIAGTTSNILIALIFAIIGLAADRFGFPPAPLILGLILSSIMEDAMNQSLTLSGGDYSIFITHPISACFLLAAILFVLLPLVFDKRKAKKQQVTRGLS